MTPRRSIPLLFLALWLVAALHARAQQQRVWVLNSDRAVERYRVTHDAFKEAWGEATVDIDLGRLRLDAFEVTRRTAATPAAAVYCIGSKAYIVATQLLPDRRIILSSAINWQRLPLVPDRAIVATEMGITAQLTLFRHFFPDVRRIGLICSRAYNSEWATAAQIATAKMNIRLEIRLVDQQAQAVAALEEVLPSVDAIWLVADPVVLADSDAARRLLSRAESAGVPVFTFSMALLEMGATLAIAPDDATIGRQAAELLRGAAPHEILEPAGTSIGLNLRAINALGIRFNEKALDSVDRLIR